MNQLWHVTTLLNHVVEVEIWVFNELLYCVLISKNTVLVVVLENSQVWLTWHKKTFFDYMH